METTIAQTTKVLFTAKTHTTGGREGASKSSDGQLEVKLATPGTDRLGTNPEQLFAAGWSACFEGAIEIAARKRGMAPPENSAIDAEIDLCMDKGEFFLRARLNISLPELDRAVAKELIDAAEKICPYAKAIKGNVEYELNLV
jgi:lipoyl-dependent peroxiredoxin